LIDMEHSEVVALRHRELLARSVAFFRTVLGSVENVAQPPDRERGHYCQHLQAEIVLVV